MESETTHIGNCVFATERLGSGPPIVILHNEDGPAKARPFLKQLAEHFEVLVPNLVGWPDTRRAPYVRSVRDIALVVQEYIEQLKRPVAMVGLSFGGWVAAELASNSPSLISALALASPIGVKIGGREDRDFADLYFLPARERDALYYAPGRLPPLDEDSDLDVFVQKAIADEAIARYCWQPYMHDPDLRYRLRRISAPTLLLSGDTDGFVLNPGYYDSYAKLIPGARHEVMAGAGHRIEEEEPQMVAEHIISFVM